MCSPGQTPGGAGVGAGDRHDVVFARAEHEGGQLDLAQGLQEWWHVHAEAAAIALAEAVPSADRIAFGAAPRLDGALLGELLLIGRAELDPVALFDEPRVQVVNASQLIPQLGRPDLAEQRWRVSGLVRPHCVGRVCGDVLSSHGSSFVPAGIRRILADSQRKQQTATRGDERRPGARYHPVDLGPS